MLTFPDAPVGRIFSLTYEDAVNIIRSESLGGSVWMTDPYSAEHMPCVTFTISQETMSKYALYRPQFLA